MGESVEIGRVAWCLEIEIRFVSSDGEGECNERVQLYKTALEESNSKASAAIRVYAF
jgi:hypothetical protein